MNAMHDFLFRGLKAHYRTWGEGRPVLFLHSGGASGAQWEKMAVELARDCRMIAPDLLGFGATEAWPVAGALTHDLQAELAAAALTACGSDTVDVVGHSYGGATAIRMVVNDPSRVRSLVLIEPVLGRLLEQAADPMFPEYVVVAHEFLSCLRAGRPAAAWECFIDSRSGAGTWKRLSPERQQRFIDQTQQTGEGFLSNLNNRTTLAECRAIDVSVTMVNGAATTAPDRRVTELIRDLIGGAGHAVVPAAGHMSPMTHPVEVAGIVRAHLARCAT